MTAAASSYDRGSMVDAADAVDGGGGDGDVDDDGDDRRQRRRQLRWVRPNVASPNRSVSVGGSDDVANVIAIANVAVNRANAGRGDSVDFGCGRAQTSTWPMRCVTAANGDDALRTVNVSVAASSDGEEIDAMVNVGRMVVIVVMVVEVVSTLGAEFVAGVISGVGNDGGANVGAESVVTVNVSAANVGSVIFDWLVVPRTLGFERAATNGAR